MRKARYPQPTKDRIASPHTKPQGAWCAQCTTAPTGLQEEIARMDEIKDQLRTILEDHDAEFAGMVLEYAATLDRAGAPRSYCICAIARAAAELPGDKLYLARRFLWALAGKKRMP